MTRAVSRSALAFAGRTGTGPIASLDPTDQPMMLAHVEGRAAALGLEEISFEVPMANGVAIRHLLDRGMRMDPFYTFLMSSRPFGQFDRYIGYSRPSSSSRWHRSCVIGTS